MEQERDSKTQAKKKVAAKLLLNFAKVSTPSSTISCSTSESFVDSAESEPNCSSIGCVAVEVGVHVAATGIDSE